MCTGVSIPCLRPRLSCKKSWNRSHSEGEMGGAPNIWGLTVLPPAYIFCALDDHSSTLVAIQRDSGPGRGH